MSSPTLTKHESITSDPVVINNPPSTDVNPSNQGTIEDRLRTLEAQLLPRSRSPSPARSREREREVIREPRRRRNSFSPIRILEEAPALTSSTSLLDHLTTATTPDSLIEVRPGPLRHQSHIIHLTTLPIHQLEFNNIAWVFQTCIDDIWAQKPIGGVRFDIPSATRRGRGVEYMDDRYLDREEMRYERSITPIVKLGTIFSAEFDGKIEDSEVKYLTIIQARGTSGWVKLITSYSRQAALVDIFHEIVNGHSVLFVGAMLVDVDLVECWRTATSCKKVGSVAEAKELKGGIGVIC